MSKLALVDGRTSAGQHLKRVQKDLTAHVGTPNAAQRMLIDQCAMLSLRIYNADRAELQQGHASETAHEYSRLAATLAELLRQLGAGPQRRMTTNFMSQRDLECSI